MRVPIFDTHTDILYDIYEKTTKGETNVFMKDHYEHLVEGNVVGGIWTIYSDHDFNVIEAYKVALAELAKVDVSKFEIVLGLEGLRNVLTIDMLDELYQLGVRHAGLTWNEENHLATGVKGNPNRGLTALGKEFIDYMITHNMLIDLAHLNVTSFFDVLAYTNKNVFVSHSNAYSVCPHIRNLTDDQIKAIAKANGVIGVVAAKNFVSSDPAKQNAVGLADHIEYISNLVGVKHVGIGFDYMNYLEGYQNANLTDINHAGESQQIVNELLKRGFSNQEIEQICYRNIQNFMKEVFKK
ncbi:MAG TPA: membrane dipeptidase [Bacilli bacterium]|nr:membrane dipeptidase [Bacilli bacterium]